MSALALAALAAGEAALVAAGYALLGAHARGRLVAMVLVAHLIVGGLVVLLGSDAGLPAVLRGRAIVGVVAATFALGARALTRAGLDRAVAVAVTVVLGAAILAAPVWIEGAFGAPGQLSPALRSIAFAASPATATAAAYEIDVLHLPAIYSRTPAAVMEMHMVSWSFTMLGWLTAALMLAGALAALTRARRPRQASVLAASLVLLAALGACKGDKDAAPPPPPSAAEPAAAAPAEGPAAGAAAEQAAAVDAAVSRGVEFLAGLRDDSGMIGGHPGVTALAAVAMVSGPNGVAKDDPRVAPTLAALAKLAKPDGAIFDKDYPAYVTALSVLAFQRAGAYPELVAKGSAWLAANQFQESTGTKPGDVNYGGIGYGSGGDADLSNMHFALNALKESHFAERPEVYERAQKFIERCQNRSESNDQPWATNDGGFVYKPGASKAGETLSSGSMTFAGINSFVYADVPTDDPRIAAAMDWIRANYSVDENPGLGQKGLYYYYHMMANALSLVGEDTIRDAGGKEHRWVEELSGKILSLQKGDGSWKNDDATYWESNPGIATARAVLALKFGQSARPR